MWDQVKGAELVANSLSQYGNDIEVVFCNNDAMALGALQSIQSAGRKVGTDIYLVGVDALTEVVEYVISGDITGTVFNDHFAQSHNAADAAINYITGAGNEHNILMRRSTTSQAQATSTTSSAITRRLQRRTRRRSLIL